MFDQDILADKKSIFISRHLNTLSPVLIQLNSMGYHVQHESLIKTSPVRFTFTPATHWIFFPGRDAIRHFFTQQPELKPSVKFGVVSSLSAEYLLQFGHEAAFVGTGVDVVQIGKDFAKHIHDESVLIPQAIDSLQVIQKQLSFTNSCHNLFVYKSLPRDDFKQQSAALLVFTSPANVQAYFERYKLLAEQQVLAVGSTTVMKLKEFGIKEVLLSQGFDEAALLEAILSRLAAIRISHNSN